MNENKEILYKHRDNIADSIMSIFNMCLKENLDNRTTFGILQHLTEISRTIEDIEEKL